MCLLISSYLGASSSSSSFFLPKYSIDKIFLHSCDETIDTNEIKKKKIVKINLSILMEDICTIILIQ